MRRRIAGAILISGRGSNMVALLRAAEAPAYPVRFGVVVSNRADAAGLELARAAGVTAVCVPSRDYGGDRGAHERAVDAVLRAHGTQLVCLAGYMRLLTPGFVAAWRGRMVNIHPSLLPKFKGLDTHARAIAAAEAQHGCTVHLVEAAMDAGEVLGRAAVDVLPDDTPASLAARVLEQEHRLYPEALAAYAETLQLEPSRE